MGRLIHCLGYLEMCRHYPDSEDSPAAREGTAAHWVSARLVVMDELPEIGSLAPNGVAVTEEMIEGAQLYADLVLPDAERGPLHVESRVDCPTIHPECWGTPDMWCVDMSHTVRVYDYKFGHEYVEVFENPQLVTYAAGILSQLGAAAGEHLSFEFCIIQPRCYHKNGPVRTWRCTMAELRPLFERVTEACDAALDGSACCSAGRHCRHCPVIHACPAAQQAGQSIMDFACVPIPSEMSPAALSLYLSKVKQSLSLLKSIESGIEEEAMRLTREGTNIPGYEIQPGQGRTTWNKPLSEVVVLGNLFGVNLAKEACVTPKQAEALFRKQGIDGGVIKDYSVSSAGELKLVATDSSMLRRIFSA